MLRQGLEQTVKTWEAMGHPASIERFVLRNGKEFTIGARIGPKGEQNACYMNASHFVLNNSSTRYDYVEGFFIRARLPMALQHAWVHIRRNDSKLEGMDPTLEGDGEYMGVIFDRDVLREELKRNEVYGLLDHGRGYNYELMFRLDPELEKIVRDVQQKGPNSELQKRLSRG